MRGDRAHRRIALGAAALMAFGAVGINGTGTAGAAVPRCQGRKVKTLDFATGRVHIYRAHLIRCAVTVAKSPGKRQRMTVSVQARGSHPRVDTGDYTRHAGPVSVTAGSRCVLVRGGVGSRSVSSGWLC
ncbi:hypothetical protein ACH429_18640 [Streptomyces pathocidini]|uniref:Secreted protein n=1 Tax=Streptomyces pathocidini TaxID=1650571 RepID=A0ABW7UU03_9ACTN